MKTTTGIGDFTGPAAKQRYLAAYDTAMAECPEPDAAHDVETRHGTTRVYRFGDGDAAPIVLLPGMLGTSACHAPVIPALAAHHPVYTVDTLGEAGRSVQTAPFADLADRARCLDDVLGRLGLTGVHLVGASTGGWHAVNQAIHAPGRLASIGLLDPTTVTAPFSPAVACFGLVMSMLNRDWVGRRFLRWSMGEDIMQRADARLVLTGIRSYRMRVPFQRQPGDDDLRSIGVPVLAVFGARSVLHDSAAAARRLRAVLPGADVEVLPGAGHDLYLQQADRDHVVDRVLGFVSATGPRRV